MAGLRRTLLHLLGWTLLLLSSMHALLLLVLILLLLLLLHVDRATMLLGLWLRLLLVMHALGDEGMSTLLSDFTVEATCVGAIGRLWVRRQRRLVGSLGLDRRTGIGIVCVGILRRRCWRMQLMLGLHIRRHRGRLARRLRLGVPGELSNLEPGKLLLPALYTWLASPYQQHYSALSEMTGKAEGTAEGCQVTWLCRLEQGSLRLGGGECQRRGYKKRPKY